MTFDQTESDRIAAAVLGVHNHSADHCHQTEADQTREVPVKGFAGLLFAANTAVALDLCLKDAVISAPYNCSSDYDIPNVVVIVEIELKTYWSDRGEITVKWVTARRLDFLLEQFDAFAFRVDSPHL